MQLLTTGSTRLTSLLLGLTLAVTTSDLTARGFFTNPTTQGTSTNNNGHDPGLDAGGGVAVGTGGSLTVVNSILYGNFTSQHGLGEASQVSGSTAVSYSCVQGQHPATTTLSGPGNFGHDPLFVDREGPDDVLGTADDDLRLEAGSRCVDAGDASALPADVADLDGDGDTTEPLPWDSDGLPRSFDVASVVDVGIGPGSVPDPGAHEFQYSQRRLGAQGPGDLTMSVSGSELLPGEVATARVDGARPFATIWVVLGIDQMPTPFKGGTLVPVPVLAVIDLPAGVDGTSSFPVPGMAGNATVYVQPVTVSGEVFEFSNALAVEFDPLPLPSIEVTLVPASAFTGPEQCFASHNTPGCTQRPYDTTLNLAYQGNLPAGSPYFVVNDSSLSGGMHNVGRLNDGLYGNGASWLSATTDSWVKIDLGQELVIDRLRFGRDRLGYFDDRDPGPFTISVTCDDAVYADGNDDQDELEYTEVLDSNQVGFSGMVVLQDTVQGSFAPVLARFVKISFQNEGAAIDEVEILAPVP
jgi:hypothetical protein